MIRRAGAEDAGAAYAIYHDAVRNGTAPHYSAAEARAWVPSARMEPWWPDRIVQGMTWVDERDGQLTGVLTYLDGHLDLFFVRPGWRKAGVASALYETMLGQARIEGRTRLTTHASHLARRFLERRGWAVEDTEVAVRNGVPLTRFAMRYETGFTPASDRSR